MHIRDAPMVIATKAVIRTDDTEHDFERIDARPGEDRNLALMLDEQVELPKTADLVFRPDYAAARRTVDIDRVRAGEIVCQYVKVIQDNSYVPHRNTGQ